MTIARGVEDDISARRAELKAESTRRGILLGLAICLILALAVLEDGIFSSPSRVTLFRMDVENADAATSGPVAMLWSVQLYSDLIYLEGPPGAAGPSEVRVVDAEGFTVASKATLRLDPARNESLCGVRRPPLGATWWSQVVPGLASELRNGRSLTYKVEARVGDGWRPVLMLDSGCRGTGRG
jgi:hypothetical protein